MKSSTLFQIDMQVKNLHDAMKNIPADIAENDIKWERHQMHEVEDDYVLDT